MGESITVKRADWEALKAQLRDVQGRAEEAEKKAEEAESLREALSQEAGRLQRRCAALLIRAGKGEELEAVKARLDYLLQSEVVRLYDERETEPDGARRFQPAALDALLLYAFEKTFGGKNDAH